MLAGTAVYGTVRTVVWEDGGSDPASYPIAWHFGDCQSQRDMLWIGHTKDPGGEKA